MSKSEAITMGEKLAKGWNVNGHEKDGRCILRAHLCGRHIIGMGTSWEEAAFDFAAADAARKLPVFVARSEKSWRWKWNRRLRILRQSFREGFAKLKP